MCFPNRYLPIVYGLGVFLLSGIIWTAQVSAQESSQESSHGGHLVIIGGGLRANNEEVFLRMIEHAGGVDGARFVILPTASSSDRYSREFRKELERHGIPADRAEILDVMEHNATTATADPVNLAKMRSATAVFMAGGDQRRLVRLLTHSDGTDTPLLSELRKVYARGGMIGGTSAGASAQSEIMLAVSGLPDALIDEGLDTLDFGCTSDSSRRGLLITRGLGLFRTGIIDQHFYQFRGRLGRLTRATADQGVPFGFGIDENTAMFVDPNGSIQVMGAGFVTIIEPGAAIGHDAPHGYQISDIKLSVLSDGDTFDSRTKKFTIAPEKPPLSPAAAEYDGNFLINDIGAGGAMPFALVDGLAENRRPSLAGITFRFHGDTSHGYRFVFRKTPTTEVYSGIRKQVWHYSLLDLRLDISPIANGLKPAATQVPKDLPFGSIGNALTAIAFRGILPTNSNHQFRPNDPINRSEFAQALARSSHLIAGYPKLPEIADIGLPSAERDEITRVVAAGLMQIDQRAQFHPEQTLSRVDAAAGLRRLAELNSPQIERQLAEDLALFAENQDTVTRASVGLLLHRILQLP